MILQATHNAKDIVTFTYSGMLDEIVFEAPGTEEIIVEVYVVDPTTSGVVGGQIDFYGSSRDTPSSADAYRFYADKFWGDVTAPGQIADGSASRHGAFVLRGYPRWVYVRFSAATFPSTTGAGCSVRFSATWK